MRPQNVHHDFSFFDSGLYKIPSKHAKYGDIKNYIESLPLQDSPNIFGMHANADISYWQQKKNKVLAIIQNVPTIIVSGPERD